MTVDYKLTAINPFGILVQPQLNAFSVSALPLNQLRELVRLHHLVILRGFVTFNEADLFADYCS